MIRVAHISDVHVTSRPLGFGVRDLFNKRATTWLNLTLGRGRLFRWTDAVLAAFHRDRQARDIGPIIFSGDATNMGTPRELARAAELMGVDREPGLAVPGNHDYLVRSAAASGEFERRFAPWQTGERVEGHTYPFAQRIGDVWFVGVNSARGNRWFWDASGFVGADQLARLETLLGQLSPDPRILVTHYPIALKSGAPESRTHGLVDLSALVDVAARGGVRLWLHGHRHGFYLLRRPGAAVFPAICVGSGTQKACWSYGDYRIESGRLIGVRRGYNLASDAFDDVESFTLDLT